MYRLWKNLSISKKLYTILGLVALSVTLEVVTLRYAFRTLSAMRTFVAMGAHWNDSQKNMVINLYEFAMSGEEVHYQTFQENLKISKAYKKARLAMEACKDIDTCEEKKQAIEGFREGQIPHDDIPNFIRTMRHLRGFPYMESSANLYRETDMIMDSFISIGERLKEEMTGARRSQVIDGILVDLDKVNHQASRLQGDLSDRVARGSRVLETVLISLMVFLLLVVGILAAAMIYGLVRYFNSTIQNVKDVAEKVGSGDFNQRIEVRSKDSLGKMAEELNSMIEHLQSSLGKQAKAESASQIKSLFLANMSHEVRTPLGVITGLVEILKDPELSAEQRRKYLTTIEQTGKNLQQIINDILDISKVEAGHLDIRFSNFSVGELVENLSENLSVLAQRNLNRLEFKASGHVPENVVSDRTRLYQILTNLIGNALKFTQNGKVTVSYGVADGLLYFRVRDTGIGISSSEKELLFKPFSQLDSAPNRKHGGTGLGLLLSKRLAQSLGGDLTLESSRPGKGSTFTLVLPLRKAERPNAKDKITRTQDADLSRLNGKNVLLVEDSPDIQMLIQLFLSKQNMTVDFANNGEEGIKKAEEKKYDLILMDMQMPVVDGYMATEQLRKRGFNLPIIALTAHAMKEDRERCLKVGCNDYMTKPIDPPAFYQTLASYV